MLGNEVSRLSGTRRGRDLCDNLSGAPWMHFPRPNPGGSNREHPRGNRRLLEEPSEARRSLASERSRGGHRGCQRMKLPVVSGSEAVKASEKAGYEIDEQHGSHIILRHGEPPHRRLSVPNHKALAKGTLRALIREAGAYGLWQFDWPGGFLRAV